MGGLSSKVFKQQELGGESWSSLDGGNTPRSHDRDAGDGDRLAWLARTIETEVIPRLLLAHRAAPSGQVPPPECADPCELEEVVEFTRIILHEQLGVASAFIEAMRTRGIDLERIYLELVAPTARRLGELWESDLNDFTEVTVGLWRLQQILHELNPAFTQEQDASAHKRRALLIPAPGEQHTLGLFMVGEFFRRAGWEVWGEPPGAHAGLMGILRTEWFDVVGLSAGCDSRLDMMSSSIAAIRKASRNTGLAVMVGGPLFNAHPEYAQVVGADAMGSDAKQAILQAERMTAMRKPPD